VAQSVCSFGTLMDRSRPRVEAARHVLLLPLLGVAGEQDAGRAVGEEHAHRVVVGLGKELAGRRSDDLYVRTTDGRKSPLNFAKKVAGYGCCYQSQSNPI
jgi:hypothetical protein